MKKTIWKVMITLLICMAAVGGKWSGCKVQAETYGDFEYTVSGDEVEITAYTGKNETVEIPANINGKKVTRWKKPLYCNWCPLGRICKKEKRKRCA